MRGRKKLTLTEQARRYGISRQRLDQLIKGKGIRETNRKLRKINEDLTKENKKLKLHIKAQTKSIRKCWRITGFMKMNRVKAVNNNKRFIKENKALRKLSQEIINYMISIPEVARKLQEKLQEKLKSEVTT